MENVDYVRIAIKIAEKAIKVIKKEIRSNLAKEESTPKEKPKDQKWEISGRW